MPVVREAGRPYPITTNLGKIMYARGLRAFEVAGKANVAPRTLTEYLAGRKEISDTHLVYLSALLGVDSQYLKGNVEQAMTPALPRTGPLPNLPNSRLDRHFSAQPTRCLAPRIPSSKTSAF